MEKRFLKATELSGYTGLGRDLSKQLAKDAGAEIRYGERRIVYDAQKIAEYMESLRIANS